MNIFNLVGMFRAVRHKLLTYTIKRNADILVDWLIYFDECAVNNHQINITTKDSVEYMEDITLLRKLCDKAYPTYGAKAYKELFIAALNESERVLGHKHKAREHILKSLK